MTKRLILKNFQPSLFARQLISFPSLMSNWCFKRHLWSYHRQVHLSCFNEDSLILFIYLTLFFVRQVTCKRVDYLSQRRLWAVVQNLNLTLTLQTQTRLTDSQASFQKKNPAITKSNLFFFFTYPLFQNPGPPFSTIYILTKSLSSSKPTHPSHPLPIQPSNPEYSSPTHPPPP